MLIHIKNLKLRTVIGVQDWERKVQQDVIINLKMEFDGFAAGKSDDIKDTVDYKAVKRLVIDLVENSEYFLLDRLAYEIIETVMDDSRILRSWVEVDKPQALRFADSVSISCSAERDTDLDKVTIW